MLKDNRERLFIIISGIFILLVFTGIVTYNLIPNNSQSNNYFADIQDDKSAKVENAYIKDNMLFLTTSGKAIKYCVKSTRSIPSNSNICWKELNDNNVSVSVMSGKEYYIWIMDGANRISSSIMVSE